MWRRSFQPCAIRDSPHALLHRANYPEISDSKSNDYISESPFVMPRNWIKDVCADLWLVTFAPRCPLRASKQDFNVYTQIKRATIHAYQRARLPVNCESWCIYQSAESFTHNSHYNVCLFVVSSWYQQTLNRWAFHCSQEFRYLKRWTFSSES